MNRTLRHTLLAALSVSLFAAPALAAKKDGEGTAFVTVNGKAIPKNRADALINGQAAQGQPDSPELRNAVKEELVRREILTQEATRKGLDKNSEVQAQVELSRQGVLIGAYLRNYAQSHPIGDDQIRAEYESLKAKLGSKEYKTRHILVDTADEATALIEKLNKGEKFEELAKQSKDPGSKERGGDLGWATPTSFVKPFSDAMLKLEKGKYTTVPVKSDFGWHVIQLDDTRELKLPTFDEAKGQIAQQLQQRMIQKHVEDLRAKAKVE
ncbi:MAG: peptidylprolyl isomerase [Betaproteobacteria bacterium HGW-Betaproteobacteria-11]|nr:MAG: peptidylprolyl isomerase [Betaproteobacteria bacterium HGW-Betaproteobacteria-11]